MDSLLRCIPFMRKFDPESRKKLLLRSFFAEYFKGTIISNYDEDKNCIYIILRGSIGIKKKDKLIGKEALIVSTLRDGEHFGELAFTKTVNEENESSFICLEHSYLIGSYTDIVNNVIKELINTILNDDILLLKRLDLFIGIEDHVLFTYISIIKRPNCG